MSLQVERLQLLLDLWHHIRVKPQWPHAARACRTGQAAETMFAPAMAFVSMPYVALGVVAGIAEGCLHALAQPRSSVRITAAIL